MGERMKANYLSTRFPELLEKKGLRRMRFHDLRHSCASLLLANGVPLKHIQEWLGHADFSTTANIYAHLDYSAKITSALSGNGKRIAIARSRRFHKPMEQRYFKLGCAKNVVGSDHLLLKKQKEKSLKSA